MSAACKACQQPVKHVSFLTMIWHHHLLCLCVPYTIICYVYGVRLEGILFASMLPLRSCFLNITRNLIG